MIFRHQSVKLMESSEFGHIHMAPSRTGKPRTPNTPMPARLLCNSHPDFQLLESFSYLCVSDVAHRAGSRCHTGTPPAAHVAPSPGTPPGTHLASRVMLARHLPFTWHPVSCWYATWCSPGILCHTGTPPATHMASCVVLVCHLPSPGILLVPHFLDNLVLLPVALRSI